MLTEIAVSQFAIIDSLRLGFQRGLNIISGETGAGKSVLLKSLALLMGEKADPALVRSGSDVATVEGLFDLSSRPDIELKLTEAGLPTHDKQMIVRRIIGQGSKSRVYINGSLSTVSLLRDLVCPLVEVTGQEHSPLIEMTGQHDNRNLMSRSYHLELLDQAIGLSGLTVQYQKRFQEWNDIRSELSLLKANEREQAVRLDYLEFQLQEIEAANLKPGDDQEIEAQAHRIKHLSKLYDFSQWCESVLAGDGDSIDSGLHKLQTRMTDLVQFDAKLEEPLASVKTVRSLLKEVRFQINSYGQSLDSEQVDREALESRLNQLRSLQRKYGQSAEQILEARQSITEEIDSLIQSGQRATRLAQMAQSIEHDLKQKAELLHQRRQAAVSDLVQSIQTELGDLNMKGVQITLLIERETELGPSGITRAEFMIANSKEDSPRPIAKFASGGELSRILLALKQVVGNGNFPRTYLFDEVDTGVSGETADRVGQKLKRIATDAQVICITHLPQVASYADSHYAIQKSTSTKGAAMKARSLDASSRVEEVARLISGDELTKTSLAHAQSLLDRAKKWTESQAQSRENKAARTRKNNSTGTTSQNLL